MMFFSGAVVILMAGSLFESSSGQELDISKPCNFTGDVVFLIDASSSLTIDDYTLSLSFVKNMISKFDVAANRVRIGLAIFNRFATVTFHLSKITEPGITAQDLINLVDTSAPIVQGTLTHKGLQLVRKEMLTKVNGDRPEVPNIVVVVTDGRATNQNKTTRQAEQLKKTGAIVFAVSVGRWNSDEQLQILASKPTEDYRFSVQNFEGLDDIRSKLASRTCEVMEEKPTPAPECEAKMDMLFILDASSSINSRSFLKGKNFLVKLVESFVVSQDFVRVAAMTFDFFPRIGFHLNRYETQSEVSEAIKRLKKVSPGTMTNSALNKARKEIFTLTKGDREDVSNLVILISDGRSRIPSLTTRAAQKLRDSGVTLITIGVASHNIFELSRIASVDSKTGKKLTFLVDDYDQLKTITKKLVDDTCKAVIAD